MQAIISGLFKFPQRDMVMSRLSQVPMPYLLSVVENKVTDVDLWRLVAKANMVLPDEYVRACFAYGIDPQRKYTPLTTKRDNKTPFSLPLFRHADSQLEFIVRNSKEVGNELRLVAPDLLPKGMKKGME